MMYPQKIILCILIFPLLTFSCSTKYEAETLTLDGDWVFIENQEEITIGYLGLRFETDTLYSILEGWFTEEGKFTISGDTIIIKEFGGKINKSRRIKKLTKDTLIIAGSPNDEKYYSRKLEYTDSLKLDELNIIAEDCYGKCPQFALKLTDNGLIDFKPIKNCKTKTERVFMLDARRKNKIDSLFKWTYLQKLDTSKIAHSSVDDWAIKLRINYNNGQRTEFRTSDSEVPFRLRPIYGILIRSLRENELI